MWIKIKKAVGASLFIALGVYGLLITNYSILSMILFAFGLFGICGLGLDLFTGKCGYVNKDNWKDILIMLVINLIAGWVIGFIMSYIIEPTTLNINTLELAAVKVRGWNWTFGFFGKSILCGVIMYIAVELYKRGTPLGIFFGIPMFIMCGFQHSIANVIMMGFSRGFNSAIFLCVIGNWIGSLIARFFTKTETMGVRR